MKLVGWWWCAPERMCITQSFEALTILSLDARQWKTSALASTSTWDGTIIHMKRQTLLRKEGYLKIFSSEHVYADGVSTKTLSFFVPQQGSCSPRTTLASKKEMKENEACSCDRFGSNITSCLSLRPIRSQRIWDRKITHLIHLVSLSVKCINLQVDPSKRRWHN